MHGTGGAYGIITTSSADKLTYQHVWSNGNGGKGKVMETWSLTEATHVQPLPRPSPRPPPGPPPAPAPSPSPTPAGYKWTCFQDQECSIAGLKDKQHSAADITACERACNAIHGCAVLRYHTDAKHCHMELGPAPTLAAFKKLLKPHPGYSSCIVLKQ